MSYQTYVSKLKPAVRPATAASVRRPSLLTESQAASDDFTPPAPGDAVQEIQRRGFKDITIVQTPGHYGIDEEEFPTSEYPQPQKKRPEKSKFDKFAFVVRRVVRRGGGQEVQLSTGLRFQSEELCTTVRGLIGATYDSIDLNSTPMDMPSPFYELFFSKGRIEEYIQNKDNPDHLRAELQCLSQFMGEEGRTIGNPQRYANLIENRKVSTETLWTIFPPNELLIQMDGSEPQCWICRDVIRDPQALSIWNVTGARVDYDGQSLILTNMVYPISFEGRVDGTIDILQLPLLPTKYLPSGQWKKMRDRLINRGQRFKELLGPGLDCHAYRRYEGPIWNNYGILSPPASKIKQLVVVDYDTFLKHRPSQAASPAPRLQGSFGDPDPDLESSSENDSSDAGSSRLRTGSERHGKRAVGREDGGLGKNPWTGLLNAVSERYGIETIDDLMVLCPARIPGYCLMSKEWAWMLIERLGDVRPSGTAFESLQVDATTKALILSLIRGHQKSGNEEILDAIGRKGRGLVILLHGNPGIGKTLTAEGVAELLGVPLYSLSGGELGVDVGGVERRLLEGFVLAKKWGAIALLDEAEVVMSKRATNELERNAVVATWLRIIEHFEGIMFLTTNRVEDFDDAVRCRIHLTIHLPDLGRVQRTLIWRNRVQSPEYGADMGEWSNEIFEVLGKLNINGRRIKNLLQTAVYQARSHDQVLAPQHLRDVVKVELSREPGLVEVSRELDLLVQGVGSSGS